MATKKTPAKGKTPVKGKTTGKRKPDENVAIKCDVGAEITTVDLITVGAGARAKAAFEIKYTITQQSCDLFEAKVTGQLKAFDKKLKPPRVVGRGKTVESDLDPAANKATIEIGTKKLFCDGIKETLKKKDQFTAPSFIVSITASCLCKDTEKIITTTVSATIAPDVLTNFCGG